MWLRNACVGLSLLLPALAALHGIVLAAVHIDGAVDMDIYGAFQMESIGVLTALVVVRHSQTYYDSPGRNTIFVWAILILAGELRWWTHVFRDTMADHRVHSGLLSLTVEFYRSKSTHCVDASGRPVISSSRAFSYSITCGLTCDPDNWPHSPIRGGSANNVYVIPSPEKLTFNTATLICGASCIPAILLLISIYFKILEVNLKSESERLPNPVSAQAPDVAMRRSPDVDTEEVSSAPRGSGTPSTERTQEDCDNEHIEAPPATDKQAEEKKAPKIVTYVRQYGEIIIFSAAVLAILVIGEHNMLSPQVRYEQEPLGNIGTGSIHEKSISILADTLSQANGLHLLELCWPSSAPCIFSWPMP